MPSPAAPYLDAAMRVGNVSYNGFRFPPAIASKVQIEPVYESSGRVPKWFKHTLTIEFLIVPNFSPTGDSFCGSSVDTNVEAAKRVLSVPGGTLVFSLQGLGAATQDTASQEYVITAAKDMNFGPRPMLWTWESVGTNRAVRVQWSVEFCIPVCCFTDAGDGICDGASQYVWSSGSVKFTEFNYSISFTVNEEGFMTRTLVGSAEIAGTLVHGELAGGGDGVTYSDGTYSLSVPNSSRPVNLGLVQNYVTNLFVRIPGFHRDFQWDVSRDHRRVEWRITDTEIPSDNPYISGVLKCDVSHRMQSVLPFFRWNTTIRGSFTIMPNVNRIVGLTAFLMIVRDRFLALSLIADQEMDEYGSVRPTYKPTVPTFIPRTISFEESLFTRNFNFEFNYELFCSLDQIIVATRMGQPLATGDWATWNQSVPLALRDGRGKSMMTVAGTNSGITTVCTGTTEPTNIATYPPLNTPFSLFQMFSTGCPPKDKSWLDYKLWFTVLKNGKTVVHQKSYVEDPTMYLDPNSREDSISGEYAGSTFPAAQQEYDKNQQSDDYRNVVQAVSRNKWTVVMHGYAIRACYDVPIPVLNHFGGSGNNIPVQKSHRIIPQFRISSQGKVPIFAAGWHVTYELPEEPTGKPMVDVRTDGNPTIYLVNGLGQVTSTTQGTNN